MSYGIEITNTDGSILIGEMPPLLQVIEQGTITIVDATGIAGTGSYPTDFFSTYFGVAKMPASAAGKQWAFSFSGDSTTNYGGLLYGTFAVQVTVGAVQVPGILFPKAWVGQSIDYAILDYPTNSTSGYGLQVNNASGVPILSTGNPMFVFSNRHVNPRSYSTYAPDFFNPGIPAGNGSVVNFANTVPSGKKPYIVGSNYLRDCWLDFYPNTDYSNNWAVIHNIHSVTNTNTAIRSRITIYYNNYYGYEFQKWDSPNFLHNPVQIGYIV
jgi:hypothetical protein